MQDPRYNQYWKYIQRYNQGYQQNNRPINVYNIYNYGSKDNKEDSGGSSLGGLILLIILIIILYIFWHFYGSQIANSIKSYTGININNLNSSSIVQDFHNLYTNVSSDLSSVYSNIESAYSIISNPYSIIQGGSNQNNSSK